MTKLTEMTGTTEAGIEVHALRKSFGPRAALTGVDLAVGAGESVTLVGPNGAGKTTLLRVLAGLARPTAGSVRIAGADLARAGPEVRRRIGFLSHPALLYGDLTAEQNLRFYARLYDLGDGAARIADLLERVGLAARAHDRVRSFSRGMERRLALARAVLHCPRVLLLDEPYTGLDAAAAQILDELRRELAAGGGTILLTTHNLERGLARGERIAVLSQGRVVYDERREAVDAARFPATYRALTAV